MSVAIAEPQVVTAPGTNTASPPPLVERPTFQPPQRPRMQPSTVERQTLRPDMDRPPSINPNRVRGGNFGRSRPAPSRVGKLDFLNETVDAETQEMMGIGVPLGVIDEALGRTDARRKSFEELGLDYDWERPWESVGYDMGQNAARTVKEALGDLAEKAREIELPKPNIPRPQPVELPEINLPQLPPLRLPELPPIRLPEVKLPELPPIRLPEVKLPELPLPWDWPWPTPSPSPGLNPLPNPLPTPGPAPSPAPNPKPVPPQPAPGPTPSPTAPIPDQPTTPEPTQPGQPIPQPPPLPDTTERPTPPPTVDDGQWHFIEYDVWCWQYKQQFEFTRCPSPDGVTSVDSAPFSVSRAVDSFSGTRRAWIKAPLNLGIFTDLTKSTFPDGWFYEYDDNQDLIRSYRVERTIISEYVGITGSGYAEVGPGGNVIFSNTFPYGKIYLSNGSTRMEIRKQGYGGTGLPQDGIMGTPPPGCSQHIANTPPVLKRLGTCSVRIFPRSSPTSPPPPLPEPPPMQCDCEDIKDMFKSLKGKIKVPKITCEQVEEEGQLVWTPKIEEEEIELMALDEPTLKSIAAHYFKLAELQKDACYARNWTHAAINLPRNMIKPPDPNLFEQVWDWLTPDESETVTIRTLPAMIEWTIKHLSGALGDWGQEIEVPGEDGGTGKIHLPDIGTALSQITLLLMALQNDEDTVRKLGTRSILEAHLARQQATQANYGVEAIIKFLAFNIKRESLNLPATFDNPNPNQVGDIDTKEELENFLRFSNKPLPIIKYDETRDFKDDLKALHDAASVIMSVFAIRFKREASDEEMGAMFRQLIDAHKVKPSKEDENEDWDAWINKAEQGFITEPGITDFTNPYGRDLSQRPRIREIGIDETEP